MGRKSAGKSAAGKGRSRGRGLEDPVVIPDTPPKPAVEKKRHRCFESEESNKDEFEEFTLAASPSVLLNVLTDYGMDANALARLEASDMFIQSLL